MNGLGDKKDSFKKLDAQLLSGLLFFQHPCDIPLLIEFIDSRQKMRPSELEVKTSLERLEKVGFVRQLNAKWVAERTQIEKVAGSKRLGPATVRKTLGVPF